MKSIIIRVKNILIRPQHEWQVIKDEKTTYRKIIFRYVGVLAMVPPAAALAGRIIFDSHIPNSALASSAGYLVLTNMLWYCMYVINVVIVGVIISAMVLRSESGWNGLQALKVAAYSFTPLFIAGFIVVLPRMGWVIQAAILYSVYLLYFGIIALGAMRKKQAAWYAAGCFLCSSIVVGIMNLFEYFFESILVMKIVS